MPRSGKLEGMSKAGAARIAKCMGHFLHDHGQGKDVKRPPGAEARLETIAALMAAFEDERLVTHDEVDPWCIDLWHNTLLQYLQEAKSEARNVQREACHAAAQGWRLG